MKESQIIIRCTEEFKNQTKVLADREGLTMSAYITRLLKLQINEQEKNTQRVSKRLKK